MSQVDLDVLKNEARRRIHNLVEDYMRVLAAGKKEAFNEERVKIAYVVPFLEALGWNPRTDEVLPEQATLTGRADFGLRVSGRTKIFVEMKSFNKSLDGYDTVKGKHRSYAEQAIQYAWSMKADWAILTNFEEIRLYDSRVRKPEDGLVWKKPIKFTEYKSRFDELWLISKESVVSGALDAYKAKVERLPVDEAFLGDLMNCRQHLAEDIRKNNPELAYDQINESVQKILDRLIFIKNCEDRLIIPAESLWKRFKAWKETAIDKEIVIFMMDLKNLFRYFDQVYNGKLFEKHPCEDLKISNEVFEEIINTLYGDGLHLGYNFNVIPVDVLGQAYELYIGSIIKEKEGKAKAIEIVKETSKRKAHGIYYTPEYVVDYLVRNTLGTLLKNCKKPEDVSKIKVLDPACGSGSFLIKAFDMFREWYDNYNRQNRPVTAQNTLEAHIMPVPNVEERILTENLYGVDLDPQAVEITILNLSLKAVRTKEKLPYMGDHIKHGNSLISGKEKDLRKYFRNPNEKKPFNWKEEFQDVFEKGGFDVVIGNPPYVRAHKLSDEEKKYYKGFFESAFKQYDIYVLFMERGIELLKKGGRLGFIVSNKFATSDYGLRLRKKILDECSIEHIIDVSSLSVFKDVSIYPYIIVLRKEPYEGERTKNIVKVVAELQSEEDFIEKRYSVESIPQLKYLENSNFVFEVIPQRILGLLERIERNTIPLGNISTITRGFRPPPTDLVISRSTYESLPSNEKTLYNRFITGEELTGRYVIRWAGKYLKYEENKIAESRPPRFFERPKIMIRDISLRPEAYFDEKHFYCLKTIYLILERDKNYDLRYITGILNSKVIDFYFKSRFWAAHIGGGYLRFRKQFLEQLPIRVINYTSPKERQKKDEIIELVDKMLSLNKELSEVTTDFERYITEPIVDHVSFRKYYDKLSVDDKQVVDATIKGSIRKLIVEEQGYWLVFKVNFVAREKGENKKFNKIEVLKCRFKDNFLRKFLFYYINNYKRPLGTGNLLYKILTIKIPVFDKDSDENKRAINKIIGAYLRAIEDQTQLEKEIRATDDLINDKVYELYDLAQEDISLIESSI